MADSTLSSSMFMVSGRMSTNTRVAPTAWKAVAVDEKVKLGRITSSPGSRSQRTAAISRAEVPLVVRRTFSASKRSSIHLWHLSEKGPSPQILWFLSAASLTYCISVPT